MHGVEPGEKLAGEKLAGACAGGQRKRALSAAQAALSPPAPAGPKAPKAPKVPKAPKLSGPKPPGSKRLEVPARGAEEAREEGLSGITVTRILGYKAYSKAHPNPNPNPNPNLNPLTRTRTVTVTLTLLEGAA